MTHKEREAALVEYGRICRNRAASDTKAQYAERNAIWNGANRIMLSLGRFTQAELDLIQPEGRGRTWYPGQ